MCVVAASGSVSTVTSREVGDLGFAFASGFRLTGVGRVARNPQLLSDGGVPYARLCLVGGLSCPSGRADAIRYGVASLWFIAPDPLAELVASGARKGDEVLVGARVSAYRATRSGRVPGSSLCFIVERFEVTSRRL
jgi:hypothetical protein